MKESPRDVRGTNLFPQISGPFLVLGAIAILELLSWGTLKIPNPPAILLLIVVFSAFIGGVRSGLVAALIAWGYFDYFFSIPGHPFQHTTENFRRVLVWALTTPAMAIMVGILKQRNERAVALSKENAVLAEQIAERKQVEQALHESEGQYRTLFERVPVGLIRTSPDGTILDANPGLVEMLGFPNRDELLTANMNDLYVNPQERQEARAQVERVGDVSGLELHLHRHDGTPIWVRANGRVIRDAAGRVLEYEGAMWDVTDRKQVENEIRTLNKTLEERVRQRTAQLETANHELEAFSYSVAHDLRSPLITIGGFSRMLIEDHSAALPEDARRLAVEIAASTQHMSRLINDLLALSQLGRQPIKAQPVSPAGIVRQAMAELDGTGGGTVAGIRIGDLPRCQADPGLLQQVYVNLLSNALKFSRNREDAVIEVGWRPDLDEPAYHTYFVKDNGAGFDMQYGDKLFRIFQRLHRQEEYEGTGVGLAIVQRIIHRHGGRVWAEGEVGKGAIFYFTLARSDAT